jgi:hypothetical protein
MEAYRRWREDRQMTQQQRMLQTLAEVEALLDDVDVEEVFIGYPDESRWEELFAGKSCTDSAPRR